MLPAISVHPLHIPPVPTIRPPPLSVTAVSPLHRMSPLDPSGSPPEYHSLSLSLTPFSPRCCLLTVCCSPPLAGLSEPSPNAAVVVNTAATKAAGWCTEAAGAADGSAALLSCCARSAAATDCVAGAAVNIVLVRCLQLARSRRGSPELVCRGSLGVGPKIEALACPPC